RHPPTVARPPLTLSPTPEPYPLSLHDALPISAPVRSPIPLPAATTIAPGIGIDVTYADGSGGISCTAGFLVRTRDGQPALLVARSEEHTSELQSRFDLGCRLLLEKKKTGSGLL